MYGRGGAQIQFGPPVTPEIIKILMIVNLGVYIVQHLAIQAEIGLFGVGFSDAFSVVPARFWQQGWFWQPATYMWLHSPHSVWHLVFNMFALWMFGSPVASAWGDKRFLRFYLICGIGAGFLIAAWPGMLHLFGMTPMQYVMPTLGASGAVFGVLLAYSLIWPDRTIMLLFPPIPIKAIYFIPFILFLSFFGPSNVSHVGHLGGVLVGWILLQRMGVAQRFGFSSLRSRWRRYRMRKNFRAVQLDEARRQRDEDRRTYH